MNPEHSRRPFRILCVGPTPAAQRVMLFQNLQLDAVNRAMTTLEGAAGKSINVAKVLKSLGERPVAIGFLGGERGQHLRSVLDERGIENEFVAVAAPTRLCITVIEETAGRQTELVEESQALPESAYVSLESIVRERVTGCHAAVMSGTLTPGGPADFYRRCTELANATGALSIVDAQGPPLLAALKAGPSLVKPNRKELEASMGRALPDEAALMEAMRELNRDGAQRVVITAGKSATLAYDGRSFWRVEPPQIKAVNPIGSGDAFTAGLVWRLLRGEPLGEACRWGTASGAANALTTMAGEVDPLVVERLAKDVRLTALSL